MLGLRVIGIIPKLASGWHSTRIRMSSQSQEWGQKPLTPRRSCKVTVTKAKKATFVIMLSIVSAHKVVGVSGNARTFAY